jgi:hypothetical protein
MHSAPSLSQTHCRAALLSAKSRAITEVEQHVLVTVKGAKRVECWLTAMLAPEVIGLWR